MVLCKIISLSFLWCFLISEAALVVQQSSNVRSVKQQHQVDSLNALARSYSSFQENSRNTTYRYASEALLLAEKIDYKEGKVEALDMMTYWTIITGKIEAALVLGFRQLRLAEDIGNPLFLARALRNIGFASGQQTKSDSVSRQQARTQLNKALTTARSFRDTLLEASCLNALGRLYRVERNFDTALSYHEMALRQARAMRNAEQEGWALHSIGVIYEARKQYDTALVYIRRALKIRVAARQAFGEAVSLRLLGLIYYRQKKYSEALQHTRRSIAKCKNHEGLFIVKVDAYKLLASISKDMGNAQQELMAYRSFLAIKDSADAIESQNNIATLQARLDIERSEAEKQLLLRDKRIQDIQIQRERMIRFGAIGGSILLLFILGFVLKAMQTAKRRNAELSAANTEIQNQKGILEEQAIEIEIANTQLQEQNQALHTLNNEKNELMAIVSHDLKNPISAVRSFAELIQDGYVKTEDVSNVAGKIASISNRMLDLVIRLLDVNRLEQGGMEFVISNFDAVPIVQNVVMSYQGAAEAKRIHLHVAADEETIIVSADEQALEEIMDNLVSNAVKYSPHGKNIWIRMKSEGGNMKQEGEAVSSLSPQISSFPLPSFLRIEVQDEGQGISPEEMQKLFGRFVRLSARPTGGEHSTGLGLSIVKKMVEAMNGRVWCESEVGKGATFIVELPSQPQHS